VTYVIAAYGFIGAAISVYGLAMYARFRRLRAAAKDVSDE